MKKKIFTLLIFLLPVLVYSQVTITIQLPSAGFVDKKQLWNLVLINTKEETIDVFLKMTLQNPTTGEIALSANSTTFLCSKGVKLISDREVQPVLYNSSTPEFSNNFIPMGTYIVCYRVFQNTSKGDELLGEECTTLNIEPLSPPLLNTPYNNTEVQTPYPLFSWMPPTPFDMFTGLTYEIQICEIQEGQKPLEAMMYNIPIFTKAGLNQTTYNYQPSFNRLQEEKLYAWQVTALNGMNYRSKTEVWSFKVKRDSIEALISGAPFIKLNYKPTEPSIAHQGFLKINLRNYLTDSIGSFTIRDVTNTRSGDLTNVLEFKMPLVRGDNFIEYDLNKHKKLSKTVYEVEYKNSLGQSYFMRFIPIYYR